MQKHHAALIVYDGVDVADARTELAALMPLYTAFVSKPEESGRAYIASVHRLVRALNDDPYEDTIWGVITGPDATSAKRTAFASGSLTVDSVLATTGLGLEGYEAGYSFSDGKPGDWTEKTVRDGVTRGNGA